MLQATFAPPRTVQVFANFIVSRYEIDAKQTKAATTKIEKNKKSKCKAKSRSEEKKQ